MGIQLTPEEAKWAQKYAKQLDANASSWKFMRWLYIAAAVVLFAIAWMNFWPKETHSLDKVSTLSTSDRLAIEDYVNQAVSNRQDAFGFVILIAIAATVFNYAWRKPHLKDSVLAKVIRSELLEQEHNPEEK